MYVFTKSTLHHFEVRGLPSGYLLCFQTHSLPGSLEYIHFLGIHGFQNPGSAYLRITVCWLRERCFTRSSWVFSWVEQARDNGFVFLAGRLVTCTCHVCKNFHLSSRCCVVDHGHFSSIRSKKDSSEDSTGPAEQLPMTF